MGFLVQPLSANRSAEAIRKRQIHYTLSFFRELRDSGVDFVLRLAKSWFFK